MHVLAALCAAAAAAQEPGYWEQGPARPFVALQPVAGPGYAKLTAQAGWGRPRWLWAGAETYAFASPSFTAVYGGVVLDLLAVSLRTGVRRTRSLDHRLVPASAAHSMDELDNAGARAAAYTTLELELSGGIPAPGGFVLWDLEGYRLVGLPAGVDVYEEMLKVAARPPLLAAGRLGYLLALGRGGWLKAGALADGTATFGRGTIVRAGPLATVALSDHLDLLVLTAVPLRSPDSLGLLGGMYGTVRLRWTWASGEGLPDSRPDR